MKILGVLFFSLIISSFGYAAETEKKISIGYPSVAAALEALKARPDAHISVQQGWTIVDINNGKEKTLWSFTPSNHPAYPAAIKRDILEKDGTIFIDMKALCEAKKIDCDALINEFEKLNEKISKRMQNGS